MQIYEALMSDHQALRSIMASLEKARFEQRHGLLEEFRRLLLSHARAEEEIFYARLKSHPRTHELAIEGVVEHRTIENLFYALRELNVFDEIWPAQLKVLRENIEYHFAEEERQFFSEAHEVIALEQAGELGHEFAGLRQIVLEELI